MFRLGQIPFLLLLSPLSAQVPGAWTSAGIEAAAGGPWSWSAQLESRWEGPHDTGFIDLAVSRKWGRHVDANFQWRTSLERGATRYTPEYRAALRLSAKGDLGRGSWEARCMAQQARSWLLAPEWAAAPLGRSALRGRVGYTHAWNGPLRWGVSTESIWRGRAFDAQRTRLDIDLRWDKANRLTLGYQIEAGTSAPDHVFRVGWSHDLGKWRPLRDRREAAIPAAASYDATGAAVRLDGARALPFPVCTADQVFLSEASSAGAPADFIELHNPSDQDCFLTGWRLDDDPELASWVGSRQVLPAHGCWLAYSDGPDGFTFGLSAEGERIYLGDPGGNVRVYELPELSKGKSASFDFIGNSWIAEPSVGRFVPPGE